MTITQLATLLIAAILSGCLPDEPPEKYKPGEMAMRVVDGKCVQVLRSAYVYRDDPRSYYVRHPDFAHVLALREIELTESEDCER